MIFGSNRERMHFTKKPRVFHDYWIVVVTFFCAFIIFLALYAVAVPAVLAVRRPKTLEVSSGD